MAFQNVKNSAPKATKEAVKLTQLPIGGEVTGYLVRMVPSTQNPDNMNFLFKSAEGGDDTFYVYTAGNIKYMIGDGLIKEGLLTKIVRLADKMVGGKKSSQFEVLQDPEATLDEASFAAIPSTTEIAKQSSGGTNSDAVRAATERASVKAQAAKLTASVRGQR